jgi:hypothetical protein
MANRVLFMLVDHGGYGNMRAELSAFDDTGESQPFVSRINAELARLPRGMITSDTIAAARTVMERYGFGVPNSAGLFEDPRPVQREPATSSVQSTIAGRTARAAKRT